MDDFIKIQNISSQDLAKSSTALTNDGNNSQMISVKTASASNINNKLVYNNSADFAKLLQNFKKIGTVDCDENIDDIRRSKEKVDQNSLNTTSFSALNSDDDESDDEKNSSEKVGVTLNNYYFSILFQQTITAKEMSRIVNYLQPVDFQSFDFAESKAIITN